MQSRLLPYVKLNLLILIFSGTIEIAVAQPVITSFSPVSGPVGTSVLISGTGFNSTTNKNVVFFGATKATVTSGNSTSLTVSAPVGATYQSISVTDTSTGLTAWSSQPFITTFSGSNAFDPYSIEMVGTYGTSENPISVSASDLDGDGKPDLVVSGSDGRNVFRNTSSIGSISFAPKQDITGSYYPILNSVSDVDGDGKPDLIVANGHSYNVTVYLNTSTVGTISFSAGVDYPIGNYPHSLKVGDLDNDGKPDLIVSCNDENIYVFRNTCSIGTVSFASRSSVATVTSPGSLSIGDLNGDKKDDIVSISSAYGKVEIWKNTTSGGAISFAKAGEYDVISPYDVAIGDFNDDNKPDFAVSCHNKVSTFINTGSSGAFSFDKVDYNTTYQSSSVSISDLDGDGKPDLALGDNGVTSYISLLKNTSSGGTASFAASVDYVIPGQFVQCLSVVDLDGDNKPDIVGANLDDYITVSRNKIVPAPAITLFNPTTTVIGDTVTITGTNLTGAYSVKFGETEARWFTVVSATTVKAVVAAGASGDVSVSTRGGGTAKKSGFVYKPALSITYTSPVKGAVGSTMYIVGNNFNTTPANNVVYLGAPKATVTAATAALLTVSVPLGSSYEHISVSDVTSGLTAYSAQTPFVTTFAGSSNFDSYSFAPGVNYATGTAPFNIAMSDMDGDGKIDLAMTSDNAISILRNTGSSGSVSFAAKIDILTSTNIRSIAAGDLNGDGKPDLVVVNTDDNTISVFINNSTAGSISFEPKKDFVVGATPFGLAIGDLDNDGRPDIVVTNTQDNTISILKNISTIGNFSFGRIDYATGLFPCSVSIGDINSDYKADIIVVNYASNNVSVFKNTGIDGSISFAAKVDYATGNSPCYAAVIGDLNAGYDHDLAIVNYADNTVSILRNLGDGTFDPKVDYATGRGPTCISMNDLDGDGKPDLLVSNFDDNTVSVLRNTYSNGNNSISFSGKVDYATGIGPYGISSGDLDGDGKPDIAVVNNTDNKVSILRSEVKPAPTISSISPSGASTGETVTITGTNFTGASAVSFGGVPVSSFTVVSSTTITAVVGEGATGNVSVTVPAAGTVTKSGFLYITPPSITSFSPSSAVTGTTVTINGTTFTGATAVSFGGTQAASFTVVSDTKITAVVGAGSSGNISITTPHGNASLAGFNFLAPQTISFDPISAQTYGAADFSPGATASSELEVTYTTSSSSVATIISNKIHIVGAGSCTIYANQPGNSSYAPAAQVSRSLTVTLKTITITGISITKSYDGNSIAYFVGTPFLEGVLPDDISNVTLYSPPSGNYPDANVGTNKPVTLPYDFVINGPAASNYSLTQPVLTGSITPKVIEAYGFSINSKIYDGTTVATIGGGTLSGVVNSEDVHLVNPGTGVFDNANAGTNKTITTNMSITGSAIGNYTLTQPALTGAIHKADLIITATGQNKVYDGNTDATVSTSITYGLVAGDVITVNATGKFNDKNAGNGKPVTATITISGANAANYSYNSTASTYAHITKALLTIGLTAQNKVYDGNTTASVNASITNGLAQGDDVTVTASNGRFDTKDAGSSKTVHADFSLSGTDAANYTYNSPSATADITKANLIATVAASPDQESYNGGTPVTFTITLSTPVAITPFYINMTGAGVNVNAEMICTNNTTWTYQWVAPTIGNGIVNINANLQDLEGNYNQSVSGKTSVVLNNSGVGISTITTNNVNISVYPTLNQGQFNVAMNNPLNGKVNVRILNGWGVLAKECQFVKTGSAAIFEVSMESAPAGEYLVEVRMKGIRELRRVIKE